MRTSFWLLEETSSIPSRAEIFLIYVSSVREDDPGKLGLSGVS